MRKSEQEKQTSCYVLEISKNDVFLHQGVRADLVDTEVEKVMKDIDLISKANTLAGKLSGGQKRKLSIGIALIGDPKVNYNRDGRSSY